LTSFQSHKRRQSHPRCPTEYAETQPPLLPDDAQLQHRAIVLTYEDTCQPTLGSIGITVCCLIHASNNTTSKLVVALKLVVSRGRDRDFWGAGGV